MAEKLKREPILTRILQPLLPLVLMGRRLGNDSDLMCRAEKRLNLPLPEMTFGNNSLTLTYAPSSSSSPSAQSALGETASPSDPEVIGISISWNALDALAQVAVGEGWEERDGGGVQVAMAEKWSKGRSAATT
jgi:type 2A phosphatase activator TIP41